MPMPMKGYSIWFRYGSCYVLEIIASDLCLILIFSVFFLLFYFRAISAAKLIDVAEFYYETVSAFVSFTIWMQTVFGFSTMY